jgi:hypothetical protein
MIGKIQRGSRWQDRKQRVRALSCSPQAIMQILLPFS